MSVLPRKAIAIMQATAAMDRDFTPAVFPGTPANKTKTRNRASMGSVLKAWKPHIALSLRA